MIVRDVVNSVRPVADETAPWRIDGEVDLVRIRKREAVDFPAEIPFALNARLAARALTSNDGAQVVLAGLAGCFAAKEALAKVLGAPPGLRSAPD